MLEIWRIGQYKNSIMWPGRASCDCLLCNISVRQHYKVVIIPFFTSRKHPDFTWNVPKGNLAHWSLKHHLDLWLYLHGLFLWIYWSLSKYTCMYDQNPSKKAIDTFTARNNFRKFSVNILTFWKDTHFVSLV